MELREFVSQFDLKWILEKEPKISLDAFLEKWQNGEAVLLDVRTKEEQSLTPLTAFGIHIPLNELPERLSEVPKDKLVCTLCPGKIRATIALCFLVSQGFDNVKVLASSPSEIVDKMKPPVVAKLRK
ncbi:MAG: rhodanese-like domain-containing protein [Thermovibrio sp.]|nr:MAG: rhodanese-like domain-containing protein [Thermovibrio sp.]